MFIYLNMSQKLFNSSLLICSVFLTFSWFSSFPLINAVTITTPAGGPVQYGIPIAGKPSITISTPMKTVSTRSLAPDGPAVENLPSPLCPLGLTYANDCNNCFCNPKTGLTGCTIMTCPTVPTTKPPFPWQKFVPKLKGSSSTSRVVRDDSSKDRQERDNSVKARAERKSTVAEDREVRQYWM